MYNEPSQFYCCKCGNKGISIPRDKRKRESGHLKKLWCLICQETFNHAEVRPWTHYDYEDFLIEFENNNFDNDGNRILPYGQLRDKLFREEDQEKKRGDN